MTEKEISRGIPPRKGAAIDWHHWVGPDVHQAILSFIKKVFIFGNIFGITGACFYWHLSQSREKIFQGAVIIFAFCFTLPAVTTSLRLMLTMFYMGFSTSEKSDEVFKNIHDVVEKLSKILEGYQGKDLVKTAIEQAKAEIMGQDASLGELRQKFDRLVDALELLAKPPAPRTRGSGLLERGLKPGSAGDPPKSGSACDPSVAETGQAVGAGTTVATVEGNGHPT